MTQSQIASATAEPKTPIETDWDFRGCDTQYGVHSLHTYVAAMIPQLARKLVECYAPVDGKVLDPFCGGGAVLAETVQTGRLAIGRDVNDLAVLISKAKTTYVSPSDSARALKQILAGINTPMQPPEVESKLAYWFKPEHFGVLYALREAIVNTVAQDDPMWSFFLAVYSATVRDVSLTYRNEIRLRKMSPEEIEKFKVDPIDRFTQRAKRGAVAVAQLPQHRADVAIGNVQDINLPNESVSAIVCSPPYGDERNGVSYSQFAKNMLGWLGFQPEEIRNSKSLTLGAKNEERCRPVSETLEASLDAICEFPASVKEAVAFYSDYQKALTEMARVVKGTIVIVIGKRVLRDTIFDNGSITVDLMRNLGVPLIERHYRALPTKRLPKMRKFGAAISKEDILVFRT